MVVGKTAKTNAARLLDQLKVTYELQPYKVDENNLGASHIASELEVPIDIVFKTIVLSGDKSGYFVCVIPGGAEIDLKKAAKISGNRSCSLIPVKELLPLTGYIRGGCSPVGMKKKLPTFIHQSCQLYDRIGVSAGMRGLMMWLTPDSLINAVNALVTDLIIPN
ncbi:MAG: Cys-tRNA(Pro) deacylase [Bacteroidales bacterium]|nr:Cys-tRNA(Pro) deacylase [Candidatus Colimorpha onthohippi]